MKRVAQVGEKAAVLGAASGQLGDHKGTQDRNDSARDPDAGNRRRHPNDFGDDGWIAKNAGAYNAAHDDQGGIERAQTAREFGQAREFGGQPKEYLESYKP